MDLEKGHVRILRQGEGPSLQARQKARLVVGPIFRENVRRPDQPFRGKQNYCGMLRACNLSVPQSSNSNFTDINLLPVALVLYIKLEKQQKLWGNVSVELYFKYRDGPLKR